MASPTPIRGRLAELLAAEAAGGSDAEECVELERLLKQSPVHDRDQLMRAASVAQLAFLKSDQAAHQALPDSVRSKLQRQAEAWNAGRRATAAAPIADIADLEMARRRRQDQRQQYAETPATRWRDRSRVAWYVAAALAVIVVGSRLMTGLDVTPATADLQARREALVKQAPDALTVAWSSSAEPGFEKSRGDVVWSSARQEGYLRLSGLPVNDRNRAQYQLWVVDASRDVHPVDGGVFDITADGEIIIPIQATLPVSRPTAFAVTLEKPGGVVVSDGPMLLVAAVGS